MYFLCRQKVPKSSAHGRFLNEKHSWYFVGVRNSLGSAKWLCHFSYLTLKQSSAYPQNIDTRFSKSLMRTNQAMLHSMNLRCRLIFNVTTAAKLLLLINMQQMIKGIKLLQNTKFFIYCLFYHYLQLQLVKVVFSVLYFGGQSTKAPAHGKISRLVLCSQVA